MSITRPYPSVIISSNGEHALRRGHPWVFADELQPLEATPAPGGLCDVYSEKGRYLGTGFFNANSKIRIRILSQNANDRFDAAFWTRRVNYALDYRRTVMGSDFSCCRLIFGEADGFPGLTVDRFGNILVAQVLSLGMELQQDLVFPALVDNLRQHGETVNALCLRNDVAIREKEGLPQFVGFYSYDGLCNDHQGNTIISENGIQYKIDFLHGQKTGFFLDQKYNRQAAARLATGRRVLDCFTHTGSFALNAAKSGADHVTAVDISKEAIALTETNAKLNGLEQKMDFLCTDVFDLLTEMETKKHCPYDYIILDPPAFTKSSSTVRSAFRGYKAINAKAMRLLPRGGYLATCSCSHFMTDTLFRKMLQEAALDTKVQLRQVEARQQAPDHPILWNVPETDYLKFYIFQVV